VSPDTLGLHRVIFVTDDVLARLRAHGVEPLEVAQYEDGHRLWYLRTVGPG
jgi:hypothetical protein